LSASASERIETITNEKRKSPGPSSHAGDGFDTRRSFLAALLNQRVGSKCSLVECELCERIETITNEKRKSPGPSSHAGDGFDTRRSFLAALLNQRTARWLSASSASVSKP